jgi:hypothetical protein
MSAAMAAFVAHAPPQHSVPSLVRAVLASPTLDQTLAAACLAARLLAATPTPNYNAGATATVLIGQVVPQLVAGAAHPNARHAYALGLLVARYLAASCRHGNGNGGELSLDAAVEPMLSVLAEQIAQAPMEDECALPTIFATAVLAHVVHARPVIGAWQGQLGVLLGAVRRARRDDLAAGLTDLRSPASRLALAHHVAMGDAL